MLLKYIVKRLYSIVEMKLKGSSASKIVKQPVISLDAATPAELNNDDKKRLVLSIVRKFR